MDRPPYQARPDNAELTLSLDEIESLEADRGKPLKDGRVAAHFTHRVRLTVREYIGAVQRLTYELEGMQARSRNRAGVATTLNPMDAAQYLTADQRAELFDATMRAAYTKVERARAEAERETQEARKLCGRIRLALSSVLNDPTIDHSTRDRLSAELQRLDEVAPPPAPTVAPGDDGSVDGDTLADIFGGR